MMSKSAWSSMRTSTLLISAPICDPRRRTRIMLRLPAIQLVDPICVRVVCRCPLILNVHPPPPRRPRRSRGTVGSAAGTSVNVLYLNDLYPARRRRGCVPSAACQPRDLLKDTHEPVCRAPERGSVEDSRDFRRGELFLCQLLRAHRFIRRIDLLEKCRAG